MKKIVMLLVHVCCFSIFLNAQTPSLKVSGKENPQEVYLQKLDIKVDITGNFATTTMTMVFKNRTAKILEGELLFPLPEGTTVSGYALDMNGKMRQAVPVEKAKATQVFEEIERRRVDPGLLEKVEGNNFRTRIYPIPGNGSRTVSISYEQELNVKDGCLKYILPTDYKEAIDEFSLTATIFQTTNIPHIEETFDNEIKFDKQGQNYVSTFKKSNYKPQKSLQFSLPIVEDIPEIIMQPAQSSYYFYVNTFLKQQSRAKEWGNIIGIIWDASFSAQKRDIKKELDLLDILIKKKQNVTIQLAMLSYDFNKTGTFTIKDGNWDELRKTLENTIYDGGTNYKTINLQAIAADEYLLFSDGISTLSDALLKSNKPVHCVASTPKSDYSSLKWIALQSKGKFINLNALSKADAESLLMTDPLQFLGIKSNTQVREVYPAIPTPVQGNISVAGIADANQTTITLQFGYGQTVTMEKQLTLNAANSTSSQADVHRIWAQKKIAELDLQYEKNKEDILELGQQFGIVTRSTSLIVLETLQDYITYRITPPEELLEAYNITMKRIDNSQLQQHNQMLGSAKAAATNLEEWWKKEFKAPKPPKYPTPQKSFRFTPPVITESVEADESRSVDAADIQEVRIMERENAADLEESKMMIKQESIGDFNRGWSASDIADTKKAKPDNSKKATIQLADIKQDQDYLKSLTGNSKKDYEAYLQLRPQYENTPSFYFDMCNWFYKHNDTTKALLILSNIADLDLENASLFKTLAYKFKEYGKYEEEVFICKKVLQWRPMEPQSYRDYGLALADAQHYQQALDTLYTALIQPFAQSIGDVSRGIEEVLVMEINQLIELHGSKLNTSKIDKSILKKLPIDIRVVINWNMNNTDIDLHVKDPRNEECYYSHKTTDIGGRISSDITRGYGPEQFLLKKAIPGKYQIEVNYFGDSQVKLEGPSTIMAEIYTYYGTQKQECKMITVQLNKKENSNRNLLLIGEFIF